MAASNNQQLTNKDTICWIKESVDYLKISQDEIKEESIKFFGDHCARLNKKTISNKLSNFVKEHDALK